MERTTTVAMAALVCLVGGCVKVPFVTKNETRTAQCEGVFTPVVPVTDSPEGLDDGTPPQGDATG